MKLKLLFLVFTSVLLIVSSPVHCESDVTDNVTPGVKRDVTEDITTNVKDDVTKGVTAGITSDVTTDVTPGIKGDVTPGVTSSFTEGIAPDVTADVKAGVTPDVTFGVTDGVTVNVTPDVEPDVTAGVTNTITDGVTAGVTVMQIFTEWTKNFETIESFSRFAKKFERNDESRVECSGGGGGGGDRKLFKISDADDEFDFSGPLDEEQLPNGFGTFVNRDVSVGARDFCFRGRCRKSVVRVVGNFSAGNLNGVAEVAFTDGTVVRAEFRDSTVHGLAVEFDAGGRQRFAGRYKWGRKSGPFCYIEVNPPSTLCGTIDDDSAHFASKRDDDESAFSAASGDAVVVVIGDGDVEHVVAGQVENGVIANGRASKVVDFNFLTDGVLRLNVEATSEDDWTFRPSKHQLQDGFRAVFMAQATWIALRAQHRHLETMFKKPGVPLTDLVDPVKTVNSPDQNNEEGMPSICNQILESLPLREGTFHETALVAALGSGSKWVGSLIEMATGVQSVISAVEVLTPMYKAGAGLVVKNHHGILKTLEEGRSRDTASWRMANIRRYEGRGILLLRNPYTAVISHWNHRNAGNEISVLQDLESSLATKMFRDFAKLEVKIWLDIAVDWLTVSPELLVVHYEDFVTDPISELESVLRFLRFPAEQKRRRCIRDNPYNKWKRVKKESGGLKADPFEGLHDVFDAAIEQVQEELRARGFKLIPVDKYKHTKITL